MPRPRHGTPPPCPAKLTALRWPSPQVSFAYIKGIARNASLRLDPPLGIPTVTVTMMCTGIRSFPLSAGINHLFTRFYCRQTRGLFLVWGVTNRAALDTCARAFVDACSHFSWVKVLDQHCWDGG